MRAAPLFIFLTLAASSVLAQNPTPAPAASTAPAAATEQNAPDTAKPEGRDRTNQRVEHIHVEDGGSRVDELRVGGQTRSITVQPKVGDMPSYEVQSNDGARSSRNRGDGDGTNGTRVWNLKKF
ncbi:MULTISPECIES: hypothetical protein [unclassified Delftia]|uniref:hypothetical protein n=1 Tax=unclassified Delftia TaxID=2613839 RepID=UPI001152C01C|nr:MULTISPECIES: hypothetical protein [unclassified Delftia]MCB4785337.1 hypothetical protein [Delftia sp. Lp-1]TQL70885.1 hypothetical protein FB549_4917 [Delftia sp. HK171]